MTTTPSNQSTGAQGPNTPSHVAYQVRDREGQKGFWTRIGSAWPHGDGQGFSIQLDAVPLDGRIHAPHREREDDPLTNQAGGPRGPPAQSQGL